MSPGMGNDIGQTVAWVTVAVLGYALVHAMAVLLAHRIKTQVRRHDLIAEARRRRLEYIQAVADRAARVSGDVTIEDADEDPGDFNVGIVDDDAEAPLAAAA